MTSETHYEKLMEMFGKKGYFCTTVEEIQQALKLSLKVGTAIESNSLNVKVKFITYKNIVSGKRWSQFNKHYDQPTSRSQKTTIQLVNGIKIISVHCN